MLTFNEIRTKTKILKHYDVLVNDDDEVLIHLPFKVPGEPESPKFYYEGGAHALFSKNGRTFVLCDFLHKDVRSILSKCDKILFLEANREEAFSEYEASLVFFEGVESLCQAILEDQNQNNKRKDAL